MVENISEMEVSNIFPTMFRLVIFRLAFFYKTVKKPFCFESGFHKQIRILPNHVRAYPKVEHVYARQNIRKIGIALHVKPIFLYNLFP